MSSRLMLKLVGFMIASFISFRSAEAQWGVGMYGAMQQCPYGVSAGAGASDYDDEIDDIKKKIREIDSDLKTARTELRDAEKAVNDRRRQITRNMNYRVGSLVEEHISKGYSCMRYKGIGDVICRGRRGASNNNNIENADRMPAQASGSPAPSTVTAATTTATTATTTAEAPTLKSEAEEMAALRAARAGTTGGTLAAGGIQCEGAGSIDVPADIGGRWLDHCESGGKIASAGVLCSSFSGSSSSNKEECEEGIKELPEAMGKKLEAKSKADGLEAEKKRLNARLTALNKSRRDELREKMKDIAEGRICYDCLANNNRERSTDWGGVAANLGVGLIATYLGMQTNRQVADYNSQMGFQTQAIPAWGYGLPFFANGIYGALGGGTGAGGFGCGSGMYGGGYPNGMMGMMGPMGMFNPMMNGMQYGMSPFGNPFMNPFMMGPQIGGGVFLPGMAPWGMNSPFGMNPYAMGGIGMGMMVNMGMMNPYMQVGGYMNPYMGAMGGGMMMMPGMMVTGGGMMMMPGYMMPGGGMMMMPGMMVTGGGMMMMPGYPGIGNFTPGMMVTGGGMMMMPGYMMGSMAGGMMYSPYGMINGMMNGGIMMNGMGQMMNNQWQMQLQQQMYQMQMQQQQVQMQMVQRQQAEYMQRQQVVMGLQSELQGLLYRIQMVSSGGAIGYGGVGGSLGFGAYGGIGGGMGLGGYGNGYVTGNGGTISGGTLGVGSSGLGLGGSFGSGFLYNNQYVPLNNNGLYNNNLNNGNIRTGTR